MGDSAGITAADIITQVRHELRDPYQKQYPDEEMLNYLNVLNELVYNLLVDASSELVRTGTGTILTENGKMEYALSDEDMGDFWTPWRVWIPGNDQLEKETEEALHDYEFSDGTIQNAQPTAYFLRGDEICFLPEPDDVYTVNLRYYPNFVPLAGADAVMPYRGLFNMQFREGMKIYAKNRESLGIGIEASLMQIFQDRALVLTRRRRPENYQMIPRL